MSITLERQVPTKPARHKIRTPDVDARPVAFTGRQIGQFEHQRKESPYTQIGRLWQADDGRYVYQEIEVEVGDGTTRVKDFGVFLDEKALAAGNEKGYVFKQTLRRAAVADDNPDLDAATYTFPDGETVFDLGMTTISQARGPDFAFFGTMFMQLDTGRCVYLAPPGTTQGYRLWQTRGRRWVVENLTVYHPENEHPEWGLGWVDWGSDPADVWSAIVRHEHPVDYGYRREDEVQPSPAEVLFLEEAEAYDPRFGEYAYQSLDAYAPLPQPEFELPEEAEVQPVAARPQPTPLERAIKRIEHAGASTESPEVDAQCEMALGLIEAIREFTRNYNANHNY